MIKKITTKFDKFFRLVKKAIHFAWHRHHFLIPPKAMKKFADKDGYTWSNSSEYVEEGGYQSFSSAMSHSSLSTKALNPDNYLATSRKYLITENSQLRFMVSAENKDFAAEHYGIAVSTKSNYNVGDFEMIWNETLPQDDNSTTAHGTWYAKTVDLSKYAGQ